MVEVVPAHFINLPPTVAGLTGGGAITPNSTQSLQRDGLGDETWALTRHVPGFDGNLPTIPPLSGPNPVKPVADCA